MSNEPVSNSRRVEEGNTLKQLCEEHKGGSWARLVVGQIVGKAAVIGAHHKEEAHISTQALRVESWGKSRTI